MKNWENKLKIWTENKEANESLSTEIVVEFMREEIYPLLIDVQEKLSKQDKSAEIFPASPEEITTEQLNVCISTSKSKYFLKFEKNIVL